MTDANESSGVGVEYDPDRDLYTGSFDESETEPSMAVVEAVATVSHTDPMNLEPLYRSVDTDALDSIVANAEDSSVSVSFRVEQFDVRVYSDGTIEIQPPESVVE